MRAKYTAAALVVLAPLLSPLVSAQDSDADRANPKTFANDAAITAKIKANLAAEHLTSLAQIHVDTDKDGLVTMHGSAPTREAADKAVEIAKNTAGVTGVRSNIKVASSD